MSICELEQLWAPPLARAPFTEPRLLFSFSWARSSCAFLTREVNWLLTLSSFAFKMILVYSVLSNLSLNFYFDVVTWPELNWEV